MTVETREGVETYLCPRPATVDVINVVSIEPPPPIEVLFARRVREDRRIFTFDRRPES
jgi:hypothetical protein